MTSSELRQEALALIDEYGWVQKHSGDRITGFCLLGALQEAASPALDEAAYQESVAELATELTGLELEDGFHARHVVTYNDSRGRTLAEIRELLTP